MSSIPTLTVTTLKLELNLMLYHLREFVSWLYILYMQALQATVLIPTLTLSHPILILSHPTLTLSHPTLTLSHPTLHYPTPPSHYATPPSYCPTQPSHCPTPPSHVPPPSHCPIPPSHVPPTLTLSYPTPTLQLSYPTLTQSPPTLTLSPPTVLSHPHTVPPILYCPSHHPLLFHPLPPHLDEEGKVLPEPDQGDHLHPSGSLHIVHDGHTNGKVENNSQDTPTEGGRGEAWRTTYAHWQRNTYTCTCAHCTHAHTHTHARTHSDTAVPTFFPVSPNTPSQSHMHCSPLLMPLTRQ